MAAGRRGGEARRLTEVAQGVNDFEWSPDSTRLVQGIADPEKLGVGGWSYGGISTNFIITLTNRFKAAITGASEVLYIANYGHDHYQKLWELELGLPWENRALYEKISPFNKVTSITTPTLKPSNASAASPPNSSSTPASTTASPRPHI